MKQITATNPPPTEKVDPIRDKFFGPLENAEKVSDLFFYALYILSIAVWLVDEKDFPRLNATLQISFLVATITSFALGQVIRLYLLPRAHDKRLKDFASNAFDVPLIHNQTVAYYNNDLVEPMKKLAAQVFENSLFSKTIASEMASRNRIVSVGYIAAFIIVMLCRDTSLAFTAIMAQAVFSEQVISRWFRIEWMRIRFERTFDDMYSLFQTAPEAKKFNAMGLEIFSAYETSKVLGGITLSSKIFNRINPEISSEWEKIKTTLII